MAYEIHETTPEQLAEIKKMLAESRSMLVVIDREADTSVIMIARGPLRDIDRREAEAIKNTLNALPA